MKKLAKTAKTKSRKTGKGASRVSPKTTSRAKSQKPKRDTKTGRFLPKKATKKKTRKPRPPKPVKPRFRSKSGQFVKQESALEFKGGALRKDYIVLDRFDSIKDMVDAEHPPGISKEAALSTFADLSGFQPCTLQITFLYMPGYGDDEIDDFVPQYMVFIGTGDKFITQITKWIFDGCIIGSMEVSDLPDGAYQPTNNHPLWNGDVIETVKGKVYGSGYRRFEPPHTRGKRRDPMDRKAPKKRNYKREKQREKLKNKELGKKRNKGNVKEQRRRARERAKQKKKEQESNESTQQS